jgi:hypothetical protein
MNKKLYMQEYQKRNRTKLKEYQRNYCSTPAGIFAHLKQCVKRRHFKILFTKLEFEKWYLHQEQICYYCERNLFQILNDERERRNAKLRLSIERLDSKKDYFLDNIVLACYRCNHVKSEYFTAEEMLRIGKVLYK